MKTANTVCLVVLCLVQTVLLWPNHDISTLKVLQVVHRHGDRSPVHFLPKDPFKNVSEYWPEGGGQLSNSGKLRMYRLGQFLRNEYQEFLGQAYSPREVYARSSLSHRCLESVEQVNLPKLTCSFTFMPSFFSELFHQTHTVETHFLDFYFLNVLRNMTKITKIVYQFIGVKEDQIDKR